MHNALFQDDVQLEGVIISDKPSMNIGAVPSGCEAAVERK